MLKKGSNITIVLPLACNQTRAIRVTKAWIEWAPGSTFDLADEGKLWLRGWHSPESKAAKAAVVAQGLMAKAPEKKAPPLNASPTLLGTLAGAAIGAFMADILTKQSEKK